MSWWVSLRENGEYVKVPLHREGGTYALEGSDEAELNITYNYSQHFHETIDSEIGIRWLNKKQAAQVIRVLEIAIFALGTEKDPDYWKTTKGNAGYSLSILLEWAKSNPNAIFEVS